MLNVCLGFVQFCLISGILLWEFKLKSPSMFLWATLFLMFGLMHFLDVAFQLGEYSASIMTRASLFAIGFCIIYIAVRFTLLKRSQNQFSETFYDAAVNAQLPGENQQSILTVLFLFACFMIALRYIIASGGLLNASWGNKPADSYLSLHAVWPLLYNSCGGLLCCAILRRKWWHAAGLFFSLAFVELITRDRTMVLPLLISIIAVFIFWTRKIRFTTILAGGIAAFLVVFIIYGIRAFRWMGTLGDAFQNFSFRALFEQIFYFLRTSNGELGLRNWFYYFIENDNQFENFGQGHTYIRMILAYLPTRFSLGIKPPDFAHSMGAAVGMAAGGSMHPTLFGDCFANLGFCGVLLGGFWAILVTGLDWIVSKVKSMEKKVLLFVMMATSYVIMARGAVYNGFVITAWGVPFLLVLTALIPILSPIIKTKTTLVTAKIKCVLTKIKWRHSGE